MSIQALRDCADRNQITTVREVKAALGEVAKLEAQLRQLDNENTRLERDNLNLRNAQELFEERLAEAEAELSGKSGALALREHQLEEERQRGHDHVAATFKEKVKKLQERLVEAEEKLQRTWSGRELARLKEELEIAWGQSEAADNARVAAEVRLAEASYRMQVHSDITAENNLLRCQAESRAETAEKRFQDEHEHSEWLQTECDKAVDAMEEAEAEVERLRAALVEIRDGRKPQVCREYELCKHEGCAASYAAFVIADIALRNEQPDCDHPFRVTGDICLNCGERDKQPAESEGEE